MTGPGWGLAFLDARRKARPLTHEQIRAQIERQSREAAHEESLSHESPRTRALGYALGLARQFDIGHLLQDAWAGAPGSIAVRYLGARPEQPTLDHAPSIPENIGTLADAASGFAHRIAQRDPAAMGALAGIVAPMAPAAVNRLSKVAVGLGEAGRLGTAPKSFLPEGFEPTIPMDEAAFSRAGGTVAPAPSGDLYLGKAPKAKPLPERYAILTAENPGGVPASAAENLRAMEMLKTRLQIMGKAGIPTKGAYMDAGNLLHENGLLVPGMSAADAKKIAASFGQNSVITHEGFHDLTTGTTTPISKIEHGVAAEAPYTELPGGNRFRMSFAQTPKPLTEVVADYKKAAGITHEPLPPVQAVDTEAGARMAKTYEGLKSEPGNPAVRAAYGQLMTEIRAQAQALRDAGYSWDYVDKDPYKSSAALLKDLRENHHISVLKTSKAQGHPLLTPDENNLFRAVHDIWGHGVEGNPFGPKGEENAFRQHAASLSPLAQRALATETRGQNSWFNFGPHGAKPVGERPFATQKAALWPTEQLGDYGAMSQASDQYIAGPALRVGGKTYSSPWPAAHSHVLDEVQTDYLARAKAAGVPERNQFAAYYDALTKAKSEDEGFVLGNGKYVTRQEGYRIAEENGQLIPGRIERTRQMADDLHSNDISAPPEATMTTPRVPPEGFDAYYRALDAEKATRPDLAGFMGTGPETITPEDLAKTQVIGQPARSHLIAPNVQLSLADWNDILGPRGFNPAEGAPGIAALSRTLPPFERGSILSPARAGSVIGNVPQEAPWVVPEPARFKRFADIKDQITRAMEHPLMREDLERGVGMGFHDWYNTDAILQSAIDQLGPELGRERFNKLMDYMGPTSISASPEPNLRLAGYQYYRSLNPGAPMWAPGFQPLYPGLVNPKLAELERLGALNPGQAPKLSRFTGGLKGNWAGLAGDRHFWRALRSYGFEGAQKGGIAYGPTESVLGDVMQNLADEGVLPVPENRSPVAAGQAAIWGGAGERTGVRNIEAAPPTFSDIFEQALHRTSHYTGMPHPDILQAFWTGKMPLF